MAENYEFRKIYNVAQECGCEISDECTLEKQLARLQAAKNWINTNFSDIFEAVEPVRTGTQSEYTLCIYFKGTKCGLYLRYRDTYNNNYTNMGYVRDNRNYTSTGTGASAGELGLSTLNLLVMKSKYGIIAGFFKNDLSTVRGGAFISENGFIAVIEDSNTAVYVADGLNNAINAGQIQSSNINGVWLSKCILATITSPVECYLNFGDRVTNCRIYSVEGDNTKFAEIGTFEGKVAYVLKLEEPTAEDYAGITTFWNVSNDEE